jgi:cytochrome c oxidase assembly protein Cox11
MHIRSLYKSLRLPHSWLAVVVMRLFCFAFPLVHVFCDVTGYERSMRFTLAQEIQIAGH